MKMILKAISLFLLLGVSAHASELALYVENDLWQDSDRFYTHGTRISYSDTNIFSNLTISDYSNAGFFLGQHLYTPDTITDYPPDPNQRPYCGYLYFGTAIERDNNKYYDRFELSLGVVGPYSFGEETQKIVHEIVDSPEPQGWDHQVDTEVGITLGYRREYDYTLIDKDPYKLKVVPHMGGYLGNFFTFANTGFTIFLGRNIRNYPSSVVVEPSTIRIPKDETLSFHLFTGVDGRAVARNITLDGNTFSDSASVDKEPFVGDFYYGFSLAYLNYEMSVSTIYRSKEFETQEDDVVFNSIQLRCRF